MPYAVHSLPVFIKIRFFVVGLYTVCQDLSISRGKDPLFQLLLQCDCLDNSTTLGLFSWMKRRFNYLGNKTFTRIPMRGIFGLLLTTIKLR